MAINWDEMYSSAKKKDEKQYQQMVADTQQRAADSAGLITRYEEISPVRTYKPNTSTVKPTVTTTKNSFFSDGYQFGDVTRTVVSKSLSAIKNNFSDGYDFGDVTKTILGVSSAPKVKSTVSSFDSSLMNKYSSMNLSQIENEYKRVTAELDSFKKANGGKLYNFIAKTGASVGVASDQTGTALSELGKADANISKINDLTREKEIISLYRKQIAIKEKLGELSEEQLQLLDNIAKAESIDDAAPFFYMSADAKYSDPSSYYKMTDSERQLGESSKKKLFEQLKGENPGKSDEELNELIDELVELRSNQRNAEQQASVSAQIGELATEHPVAAFLLSRGADLAGGMVALPELFYQRGNEYGLDINAPGFSFVNASAKIDEQIQLDHDWKIGGVDAFDLFYEAGTGIVDNVARLAFSGGNTTAAGAVMFSQVATQSIVEGKKKGYSDFKALASGLLVGTFEAVSEKLSLDAVLGSKGGVLKRLAKAFAAEGGEEVTSNWLNRIADVVANGNHSERSKKYEAYREMGYSDSKALAETVLDAIGEDVKSFVVGGIAGSVMGGGNIALNAVSNVMQKNEPVQLDEKSQTVVDKVVEALVEQEKQKGNKVTKSTEKNIRKAVINNLNKGYLDKDSIYREFGGEEYENYKKAKEHSESNISSGKQVIKNLENAKKKLQKEYDALYKMKNGDKSDEQIDRQNQIKEQIANIEAEIEKTTGVIDKLSNDQKLSDLEAKLDANVYELIKDSKLAETFREGDRRGETFKADLTKYDSKQQATIKSAIESGILNNSNRTHDFVDMVAKISADKGITFDFVNNEKIKASGFAIDGKTVNGYKTEDGKIVVNIESSKSLDSIVGHEIAHILEGTELYAELQEAVKAYATTKGEYESRLQALRELYEGVYKGKDFDDKIRAELTADIIGEYLFTDADFVNRLSAEKPNIFKKIYDEIKYLCNVATAGSKEARELEKLKHQFEKAYKESAKGNVTGTKYSIKKTSQMDYSNQLEMIEKGKLNGSNSLYIGIPSNQLQSIGFSEKPFAMNQGDYRKSRRASAKNKNYSSHAVPYDFFENMPQYLADAPLIEDNGEKATVITSYEMLDTKGNDSYVIAGVWKDQTMESDTVNQVKSVYPLDDFIHQITEAAEVGKLVCINKNKAEQMLATIGIQPAEVSRILNLSKDILPQNSEKSSGNVDYSLNETDSKYLSAVKSGDTETAQKMVDEAAKENGYDSPVLYHGTHSFGFTNFDLDKMDDKRSIFLTSSKEIASTYSGVTGSKEIGKDNTVNVADMSAEDIVKRLNEYDAEFKTGTTEGPHNYELYDFKKTNSLISKVNDGIEKLKGIVGEEIKSYVDKMARDFDDKDAKIHRQLVTLSERLDRYDYQNLSTPIYLLLHHTDVFGGSAEIAELEKNIRLMNQVRTRDLSAGVIVDEALGGYVIEIMEIDQARDCLENRLKAGNYSLYARLGKALEIDGKGALWKDIRNWTSAIEVKPADVSVVKKGDFYELVDKNTNEVIEGGSFAVNSYTDELALTNKDKLRSLMVNNTNYILRINTETMNTTRAIAKFAKERGYDSVVFKNIRDNGGWNSEVGYDEVADIYVIFDEKSVKSADAVTYDDNGEVIPLSERFNSENNDIRYSLSEDVDNVEKILYDKNNSLSIVNRAKTNNNSSLKWVYDSEIFSVEESKLFHEKISEINQGSEAFSKNSAGEYMIPIENKIIFTDGNYDSPYVREIVEVLTEYQTEYDDIRERIYNVEKGKSDKYETAQTLAKVYGNGIVVTHRNGISGVYGWENGKRKGKSRSSVIRNHLNKQLRRRDDRKSKETQINEIAPINEASSKDGVFFDGEKTNDPDVNFSLSEEGTIPPKKGRFFGRDVMYQPSDIAPRNVSASSATDDIAPVRKIPSPGVKSVRKADIAKLKEKRNEYYLGQELIGTKSPGENKGGIWSDFVRNFVSKGAVFETAALKTKNRALEDKYKMWKDRSEAKAQYFMENGNEDVPSLKSIVEKVKKAGLYDKFDLYLAHRHNMSRTLYDKPIFGSGVTGEMSLQTAAELQKKYPEFKEWAKDVYRYNDYLLNKTVEGGIISREFADELLIKYPNYVPIERLDKQIPLIGSDRVSVSNPVKTATGGNQPFESPLKAMAHRTTQVFKAVDKNVFGVELMKALGGDYNFEGMNVDDILDKLNEMDESLIQPGKDGKNPTFTVFENGERLTFEISEEMYKALQPVTEGLSREIKVLSKPSAWHKKVLTEYNLFFTARNFPKDAQEVIFNSKHAAKTYANMPVAVAELLKGKGKYVTEYWENGGKSNTYFDSRENDFIKNSNIVKKAIGIVPEGISKVNDFVEAIPRLAEYIASRKKGATVEAAMLDAARVTTDFSDGGDITKFFNRNGVTFLNASVQGASQQIRNIRQAKAEGVKGIMKLVGKYALSGLPVLLFNQLMWEDDEDYEELSEYVKDSYYVVAKYGDRQFVRIPKGRTAAVIQEATEQVAKLIANENVNWDDVLSSGKAVWESFISNIAPNNPLDNNVIAPIKQAFGSENGTAWYGDDIVPKRLQDLPDKEQYDESTDSISKWLGEKTGISPYKINYLLNQYSGFVGDIVLPPLTPEAERGDGSFMGNLLAPLKDQFVVDGVVKNRNPSDFYSLSDELEIKANSKYATAEDKVRNTYITSVSYEMGDLYAQKREIQNSDLPDDVKFMQVREIQDKINELAKKGLETYQNVKVDGNYATANGIPYKYLEDKGKWYTLYDNEIEDQKFATEKLGITPGEYWSDKKAYDAKANKPGEYAFAMSAMGSYDAYNEMHSGLWDIRADKDENGNSISGTAKSKKKDYIWNLDIDEGAKHLLFRSEYSSYNDYNYEIMEYVDGLSIPYEDKVRMLEFAGFTVRDDGYVSW